jgi:hypothetical protein
MPRTNGTTKQRGYSGHHQRLKNQWRPLVDAGQTLCQAAVCLEEQDGRTRWIQPGTPWHLGHTPDRTAWTGPEHRRCNTADGARRKNKRVNPRQWITSRAW